MSVRVMKNVWDFRLPDSIPQRQQHLAKLVLLKLADNASDDGKAFPSIERIAHECACSYRSVSRMLNHLEESGVIARQHRSDNGMKKNSIYWLNIKKMTSNADPYVPKKVDDENPFDRTSSPQDETSGPKQQTSSPINHHEPSIDQPSKEPDIFSGKDGVYVHELSKEEFPHCHEMIRILDHVNNQASEYCFYTGRLSLEEWSQCEDQMQSCDCFDHISYYIWWREKHYRSMKKMPSLPNMVCDMNGIPFSQFYDSTFLQEVDY